MIKHTIFFSFKKDVSQTERESLLSEHKSFPKQFPWMKNFAIGRNISERDQTYEYAFTIDFEDKESLNKYLLSKEHEQHVIERFRPLIEIRAIVSFIPDEL